MRKNTQKIMASLTVATVVLYGGLSATPGRSQAFSGQEPLAQVTLNQSSGQLDSGILIAQTTAKDFLERANAKLARGDITGYLNSDYTRNPAHYIFLRY
jgi:hypothetical protein